MCFAFQVNNSQENYIINGETLELKIEIDGTLDLLWNIFDGTYHYFIRTDDGTITELKNTKASKRNYLAEYKETLSAVTGMSAEKLKFTLSDLKTYVDAYNSGRDTSYSSNVTTSKVELRLGFFGGITNHPFIGNPDNVKTPLIGAELEFFEANALPRHSGFLQARHTFDNDDLPYSTTEFSLGYRYRIINTSSFSIYGQVKLVTLNLSDVTFIGENDTEISQNDTSFDAPLIFGLGSDIKVGKNSYITVIYGELFGLLLDNQGNFSTDISFGCKFNL